MSCSMPFRIALPSCRLSPNSVGSFTPDRSTVTTRCTATLFPAITVSIHTINCMGASSIIHKKPSLELSRARIPTVLTTLDQCERTVVRSLALGGRGHRQTRFLLQPPRVLLFKATDEPTSRRPRWAVGPIDGRHCDDVTRGRRGLGRDLNERAACQVRLDHVHRQAAKSKSCPQKGKLGSEVGKAPHSRG